MTWIHGIAWLKDMKILLMVWHEFMVWHEVMVWREVMVWHKVMVWHEVRVWHKVRVCHEAMVKHEWHERHIWLLSKTRSRSSTEIDFQSRLSRMNSIWNAESFLYNFGQCEHLYERSSAMLDVHLKRVVMAWWKFVKAAKMCFAWCSQFKLSKIVVKNF